MEDLIANILADLIIALIIWGIGNLLIWAFSLNFVFTYIQALAVTLLLIVVRNLLK